MYPGDRPEENHYAADRATLRRVLATGMSDVVRYGARFVDHQRLGDGRIEARFADGSTAVGDVLVGADGAASPVRRQLLPAVRSASATRSG